ncbi:MAG: iron-sulfur cluster carrier protein ApbC [Halothiobacillaceae bacterium]|nr:MAG: iron-sulfur cluster carrier protein ApbC [Halothiobacillaceae bacterium]
MALFGFGKKDEDKVSEEAVRAALAQVKDPELGEAFEGKRVHAVEIRGGAVSVHLRLGYPAAGVREAIRQQAEAALRAVEGVQVAQVTLDWVIEPHAVQKTLKRMPQVRNIIAVASGKGGVGKSTTAVNLALALQAEGAKVGILDADIYGPSVPRMLGAEGGQPTSTDGRSLEPRMAHGLQSMSIGFLVGEDNPMIWRGPMVTSALQQLLNDTNWHDLDYLIIDMPPGTGDIQLTLAQKVPVAGAVIVTTPQDIALLDAKKGLKMFERVDVPVLGIIENMSLHVCSNCGHVEPIFGEGGGARMAEEYGVELLGQLPLTMTIREQADSGNPTVAADANSPTAMIYRDIARKLAAKLARRAKDYSTRFPTIVVKHD